MYRYTLHMSLGEVCGSTCLVWAVLARLSQFSHLLTGAGGVWGGAGVALQRGWGGSPGVSLSLPCSDALSNALKPNKSEKTAISDQFCMHYTILSLTFLYLHIIWISLCISTHLTIFLTIAKIHFRYSSNLQTWLSGSVNLLLVLHLINTFKILQYFVVVPASSPIFQGKLDLPVLLNIAGCQSVYRCRFYTPVVPACPSTSDDRHYQRMTTPGLKWKIKIFFLKDNH